MKNIRKKSHLFGICEKESVTQFSKVFNVSSEEEENGRNTTRSMARAGFQENTKKYSLSALKLS